MGTKWSSQIWI